MGRFLISATDLRWIDDSKDNPEDYCLHGHAIAIIGDRKLEYDCTVSASALYLLKSITEDHIIYEDNQMLPCCGHSLIPNEELDNVSICGCPNGIDWSITHEKNKVILELEDGTKEEVPLEEYKEEVYRFVDEIEKFYASCTPKVLTKDQFDRDGYVAFWNEWHRRRESQT